jgi:hypothetical protein
MSVVYSTSLLRQCIMMRTSNLNRVREFLVGCGLLSVRRYENKKHGGVRR